MKMHLLATFLFCGLLAGCAVKISKPDSATHDLSAAAGPAPALPLRSLDVSAGPVLDGALMYYRLPNTSTRNTYANNRWSASPASLIAARLKRGLPDAPGTGKSGCHLRVEIDDLIQVFPDMQHSQLTLEGRASLFTAHALLARRNLNISVPAGTDAAGAAAVSGALVQQLAQELQTWANTHCKDAAATTPAPAR